MLMASCLLTLAYMFVMSNDTILVVSLIGTDFKFSINSDVFFIDLLLSSVTLFFSIFCNSLLSWYAGAFLKLTIGLIGQSSLCILGNDLRVGSFGFELTILCFSFSVKMRSVFFNARLTAVWCMFVGSFLISVTSLLFKNCNVFFLVFAFSHYYHGVTIVCFRDNKVLVFDFLFNGF